MAAETLRPESRNDIVYAIPMQRRDQDRRTHTVGALRDWAKNVVLVFIVAEFTSVGPDGADILVIGVGSAMPGV